VDEFAKLASAERRPYFEAAATASGFPLQIIEKDFWVCWTLKRLFALPEVGGHLVFKGGTSLSKAFGVIERFSEDIDISIDRAWLGFTGAKDPEKAPSAKQQQRLIEELAATCRKFVQTEMLATLEKSFGSDLERKKGWVLRIDERDPDGQTLLFDYPTAERQSAGYIQMSVKIELGARSDHWPAHVSPIRPYLDVHVPRVLKQPSVNVNTLDAIRTFWEKATILHMYAHLPEGKPVAPGQSRHYYDLYLLLSTRYRNEALEQMDLLKRVSEHKRIYFRAAWANYEEAAQGRLKLVPSRATQDEMKRDYFPNHRSGTRSWPR
jgi:hypothetical protein